MNKNRLSRQSVPRLILRGMMVLALLLCTPLALSAQGNHPTTADEQHSS